MAELLPIGTIVKLSKDLAVCYMIAGYYPLYRDEVREYSAVVYPGGLSGNTHMEMFDREQIESVISEGYLDEEGEALLNRLPEFMNQTAGLVKECNGIMKQAFLEDGDRTDGLEETGEFDIQMD